MNFHFSKLLSYENAYDCHPMSKPSVSAVLFGFHGMNLFKNLVSQELLRIFENFHFSISIWKHFDFTFHLSKKSKSIFFTLHFSKISESFFFAFHFSNVKNPLISLVPALAFEFQRCFARQVLLHLTCFLLHEASFIPLAARQVLLCLAYLLSPARLEHIAASSSHSSTSFQHNFFVNFVLSFNLFLVL